MTTPSDNVVEMDAMDLAEWEKDRLTPLAPDAKLAALVRATAPQIPATATAPRKTSTVARAPSPPAPRPGPIPRVMPPAIAAVKPPNIPHSNARVVPKARPTARVEQTTSRIGVVQMPAPVPVHTPMPARIAAAVHTPVPERIAAPLPVPERIAAPLTPTPVPERIDVPLAVMPAPPVPMPEPVIAPTAAATVAASIDSAWFGPADGVPVVEPLPAPPSTAHGTPMRLESHGEADWTPRPGTSPEAATIAPVGSERGLTTASLPAIPRSRRPFVLVGSAAAVALVVLVVALSGSHDPPAPAPVEVAGVAPPGPTPPMPRTAPPVPAPVLAVTPEPPIVAPTPAPKPVTAKRVNRARAKQVVLEYDHAAPVTPAVGDDAAVGRARAAYGSGNQLLFAGDPAGAIRSYRQALAFYPGYVAGYRGLGLAFAQQGDKRNALQALQTYVRVVPNAKDVALIRKRIDRLQK